MIEPDKYYKITKIPDGDTLFIEGKMRVRLIGVNTPEVSHRNSKEEIGGEVAREFLEEVIGDQTIRFELGEQPKDHFRRFLAHAYLPDGTNINALLVREGFAHATVRPPNLHLTDTYIALEKEARKAKKGMWALARYGVQSFDDVTEDKNGFFRLKAEVIRVKSWSRNTYAYFGKDLSVRLDNSEIEKYAKHGCDFHSLKGKQLSVRGHLYRRRHKRFFHLYDLSQIEGVY